MGGHKGPWYHCTVRAPVDSRDVAGTDRQNCTQFPGIKKYRCCVQSARVTCQNRAQIKGTALC
eukprot:3921237-Rhodomonas_salina.1